MKPCDQSVPQNRAILEEITKAGNKTKDSANSHGLMSLSSTPYLSPQSVISPHLGHPHRL